MCIGSIGSSSYGRLRLFGVAGNQGWQAFCCLLFVKMQRERHLRYTHELKENRIILVSMTNHVINMSIFVTFGQLWSSFSLGSLRRMRDTRLNPDVTRPLGHHKVVQYIQIA